MWGFFVDTQAKHSLVGDVLLGCARLFNAQKNTLFHENQSKLSNIHCKKFKKWLFSDSKSSHLHFDTNHDRLTADARNGGPLKVDLERVGGKKWLFRNIFGP